MRPRPLFLVVVILAALVPPLRGARAQGRDDELARARVLDHEGVHAYREGRYKDAIRYFGEALKLGGPPSEMWNIAKCHLHLDEPEQASEEIQKYLAQSGLSAADRAEATEQLQELQRRRSTLTVSSSPGSASVFLDGRREASGTTPLSIEIAPGTHAVAVDAQGYRPFATQVDAHFGRAVIVDAQLTRGEGPTAPPPPARGKPTRGVQPPPAADPPHAPRIGVGAQLIAYFPRLGGYGESAHAGFALAGSYYLHRTSELLFGIGLRVGVTSDSWSNTIAAPRRAPNCGGALPLDESATEVSIFGTGSFAYFVSPRLRIGGDAGLGLATYSASEVGGDLFLATCQPGFGVKPALHLGAEASYSLTSLVRMVASPLMLELHPAFDGARTAPIDVSGLWLRLGIGLGVAVDL